MSFAVNKMLIVGRPFAPPASWWADIPPDGFTAYVVGTQLERMRASAFAHSLAPRSIVPREVPANDDYLYQTRES
jgi:hypothetical protein